jgi:hypothetical protein
MSNDDLFSLACDVAGALQIRDMTEWGSLPARKRYAGSLEIARHALGSPLLHYR